MRKNGFSEGVNYIVEIVKRKFELDMILEIQKQVNNLCRKVKEKYQRYICEKNSFEYIKRKLDSKNLEEFTDSEKKIENRYYKKFYDYLFKLPRPVVGIYYKEDNTFKILCADHFDNTINKYTKIDLKSITQNSPIMAEIEAGYSIYALHKDQKRKEELHDLEKKKCELEIQNLESDLELKEQQKIKNELDILNKALELKARSNALADEEENLGVKSLTDSYVSKQILSIYGKVQNGYDDVLKTNHFLEKSSKIIDMKI